jgi:hypothetical protein
VIYWRSKHWDGCSGSSGVNQGHADTVQSIERTVPVHAVTEMEERIEGEVMEERNIFPLETRSSRTFQDARSVQQMTWQIRDSSRMFGVRNR